MKHLLVIALSALIFGQAQSAVPGTEKINYMPEKIFIPNGFDDNDSAQVMLEGYFPDTCYKSGPVHIKKDLKHKEIQITHVVYKETEKACLEMIVPYYNEVDFGRLPSGDYRIVMIDDNGQKKMAKTMKIKPSKTKSGDDYIYAPVEDVSIHYPVDGAPKLVISGTWTTNCAAFDRIEVVKDQDDVAIVLPILKYLSLPNCVNITDKFRHEVDVPFELDNTSLVHVRALNGRSLNIIGNFR